MRDTLVNLEPGDFGATLAHGESFVVHAVDRANAQDALRVAHKVEEILVGASDITSISIEGSGKNRTAKVQLSDDTLLKVNLSGNWQGELKNQIDTAGLTPGGHF